MTAQGAAVADLTVPVRGDLTPLRNDLATARRELDAFSKSMSGKSGAPSGASASSGMKALTRDLSAANDNALKLAKSIDTVNIAEESLQRMTQALTTAMAQFASAGSADTSVMTARIAELERQVGSLNSELQKLKMPPAPTNNYDQLRMKIDAVYAASVKYESELKDINLALEQNVINSRQAMLMTDQLNASYTKQAAGMIRHNDVSDQAGKVTKNLAFQQRNLSMQLLDTGQSLALGMPPLQVLLQQGPQIAQIWGANEGGVGRAFRETGKQVLGLVTKFPVLTAAIAVAGVTMFAMKQQLVDAGNKAITYGDIMVGLWKTISDGVGSAFAPLMPYLKTVWDYIVESVHSVGNLVIKSFMKVYADLKFLFGNFGTIVAKGILGAVNVVIDGIEQMINFAIDGMNKLVGVVNSVVSKIPGYDPKQDAIGEFGQVKLQRAEAPALDKAYQDAIDTHSKNISDIDGSDPLGDFYDAWKENSVKAMNERLSKKKKGRGSKEDPYEKIIRDSKQFIEMQNLEANAIGQSEEKTAALRYEQEMLNKAADAHIKLTEAQKTEIHGLAEEMAKAEQHTKDLKAAYDFGKETFKGFFTDLTEGLENGKGLWKSFADAALNALKKIGDKLLDSALNGIFDSLWTGGGAGGGVMGGLFSWITGGHATGTSFSGGGWKMVGEQGPELMKVPGGSQVIPNNRIKAPAAPSFSGSGSNDNSVTIVQHLSANGDKNIREIAYDAVQQGLDDYDTHKLPQSVERVSANPRMR